MNVDLFLVTEEGHLLFHSKGKGFIPVPTPNRLPVIQISAVTQAALVLVGTLFSPFDVCYVLNRSAHAWTGRSSNLETGDS